MKYEKFKNKFRIPSARATWHNYNAGIYFVTICTKNMEHYFGEITTDEHGESKMILSKIGEYVEDSVKNISQHNPYVTVPLFVVMPNHIHLLVNISDDGCRDAPWHVSTWRIALKKVRNEYMQSIANQQGRLSTAIGGLKQAVTIFANENDMSFAWQPRFHDHIIRTTTELNDIATYIKNNVTQWESDKFYL